MPDFEPHEYISMSIAARWLGYDDAESLRRLCDINGIETLVLPSSADGKREQNTYRVHMAQLKAFVERCKKNPRPRVGRPRSKLEMPV